jgi:ribonuclease Z
LALGFFIVLVSAILIRIPNYGSILLEAGEGTWGQLCRQYGMDKGKEGNVWDVLRDIKAVFLSHTHGDHHMGITQILLKRQEVSLSSTL